MSSVYGKMNAIELLELAESLTIAACSLYSSRIDDGSASIREAKRMFEAMYADLENEQVKSRKTGMSKDMDLS